MKKVINAQNNKNLLGKSIGLFFFAKFFFLQKHAYFNMAKMLPITNHISSNYDIIRMCIHYDRICFINLGLCGMVR